MAKKTKKAPVDAGAGGFPAHGDPAPEDGDPPREPGEGDEDEGETETEEEENDPPKPVDPALKAVQDQLAATQRELDNVRRQIPPPQPKFQQQEEEPDWDKLLYDDPKKAMQLHGEMIARRVTQDLTTRYERDKGTDKFWNNFYEKHKDLKPDDDLVKVLLQANLASLANIPVDEAMDKLADLTRDRILRYSGGRAPSGKKVRVEGAEPPSSKKPEPDTNKPTSLSDIIKARRTKRATAA